MITVNKADPQGRIITTYSACLLADGDPILLLARWRHAPLHTSFVGFLPGDIFIERYDRQHFYNIFAIYSGEGIDQGDDLCVIREQIEGEKRPLPTVSDVVQRIRQTYRVPCSFKGAYINFTYPVEYNPGRRSLTWRDLALDIWLPAEGPPLLLDEEEYAELDLPRQDPQAAAAVQQELKELWQLADQRQGPFAQL